MGRLCFDRAFAWVRQDCAGTPRLKRGPEGAGILVGGGVPEDDPFAGLTGEGEKANVATVGRRGAVDGDFDSDDNVAVVAVGGGRDEIRVDGGGGDWVGGLARISGLQSTKQVLGRVTGVFVGEKFFDDLALVIGNGLHVHVGAEAVPASDDCQSNERFPAGEREAVHFVWHDAPKSGTSSMTWVVDQFEF